MHVVGTGGIQRLLDGNGTARGVYRHGQIGVRQLEAIGDLASVVDLPHIQECVQLLERRGQHELVRGQSYGQGLASGDQRQHGAGEAFLGVLNEQRRGRAVDADGPRIGLIREVGRGDLCLLECELEESLHFL